MKVLVTGANGYIGQGVVNMLLNQGHEVIAADRSLENVNQSAVCRPGNLFEIEHPYEYFERPQVVLHLAWRDGFLHNSRNHIHDLSRHYDFLEKMIDAGIQKVCVMGSMHEIGFYEGSIEEQTPCNPQSLYGIAKNALREAIVLKTKEKGINFQWIRGFYIVGNSQYGCSIFSKITAAAEHGETKFPFTWGQNQFDFIDYQKFCEQVVAVVQQDQILGIINCCSGRPEKLADRVEQFIMENGYDIQLTYGVFQERPYDSKAVWGNNRKIEKIMGEKK